MKALMATTASPPGRFSTTTGWFQRVVSRSDRSRAPMSAPLPGPSDTMNLTGRCGQEGEGDWADADVNGMLTNSPATQAASARPILMASSVNEYCPAFREQGLSSACSGEADTARQQEHAPLNESRISPDSPERVYRSRPDGERSAVSQAARAGRGLGPIDAITTRRSLRRLSRASAHNKRT